ncbi:MAG: hypothetical protein GXP24_13110 [Planctomycetes bacterium]|nr:hypothetical protein [Planctomycetota bacterium]
MSFQQGLDNIGATPGKLALIGVLVLVLIVVVVKQQSESVPENASTNSPSATLQTAKIPAVSPAGMTEKDSQNENERASWPEINFSETLASDPFTPPSWAAQESLTVVTTSDDPGELAELQLQGASIVVIGQEEKSARIGEQKLVVGDILDGYQVTDITTQGIFLNKLSSP